MNQALKQADLRESRQFISEYTPPSINGDFTGKHIISVEQFDRDDLTTLFDSTVSIRRRMVQDDRGLLQLGAGKVMATLFYEASTRTDMSFQAAMSHLGGQVITASNGVSFSSSYKGENLADTVRAVGCYADVIVLRHPQVGSSYEAAYYLDNLRGQGVVRRPVVISGGDGIGEHPTQALLDSFTIWDSKGSLNDLNITLVGDLKHGRTVHSLTKLIARYGATGVTFNFVAPEILQMPERISAMVQAAGINVTTTENLHDVLGDSDVIYWTRVQEERFDNVADYEAIKDDFIMTQPVLAQAKDDAILMHPLPRKNEMGTPDDHDQLDADPRSIYFRQMENGMFMRMSLLSKVMGNLWV